MKQSINDPKHLDRYELVGANASPYSRKMLPILRKMSKLEADLSGSFHSSRRP